MIPGKSILRVGLGTLALLMIPLLAMVFDVGVPDPGNGTGGVNWSLSDFVVMGALLFVTGLLLDFAWRRAGKYRAVAVIGIFGFFLWLWVELAVGLFTNWGS